MSTSLKIDDELKERVAQLAQSQQRSAHWLMLKAIREYVEHEEARERAEREAMAAWQAYEKDGLHLSAEEFNAWLDTWGTENEGPPPPCHT